MGEKQLVQRTAQSHKCLSWRPTVYFDIKPKCFTCTYHFVIYNVRDLLKYNKIYTFLLLYRGLFQMKLAFSWPGVSGGDEHFGATTFFHAQAPVVSLTVVFVSLVQNVKAVKKGKEILLLLWNTFDAADSRTWSWSWSRPPLHTRRG